MTHGLKSPIVNKDKMLGHGGLECELAATFTNHVGNQMGTKQFLWWTMVDEMHCLAMVA